MNNKKKIMIYNFNDLFDVLHELEPELNLKFFRENNSKYNENNFDLIINQKQNTNINNQITLSKFPMKISKLIEEINLGILKQNFQVQSEIKIGNFLLNLNSREIEKNDKKLKLTEKEINIIIYLNKSNNPVSIHKLQNEVWGYQSDLETHTVETHIYRLRKKVSKKFFVEDFIVSEKNGYRIN